MSRNEMKIKLVGGVEHCNSLRIKQRCCIATLNPFGFVSVGKLKEGFFECSLSVHFIVDSFRNPIQDKLRKNEFISFLSFTTCSLQKSHTGTVVMQVGFKTDASPLQPRIILLLESINVRGVE